MQVVPAAFTGATMNKSRVLSTMLIAGSLALAIPFATQARPGGFDGGWGHHAMAVKHGEFGKRGHFMRGLDLTEAQRDKIFEARHAVAPTLRDKGKKVREGRVAMREAAKAESFDEAKVRAASERVAKAQADVMVERLRVKQQVLAVLTPEQRTKLEQAQERRGKRHHGKHH